MIAAFRQIRECLCGVEEIHHTRLIELPTVSLDTEFVGTEVVIVKNGRRICGAGAALCSVPIVQNKAYFEIKLQQTGTWGIGLATRGIELSKVPLGDDANSWVLRHDGNMFHQGRQVSKLDQSLEEGDVIGVTYDHLDLKIYVNADPTNCSLSGVKGVVYPVVYVDDGAILEVAFSDFYYRPPSGFDRIIMEQTIL